MAQPLLYGCTPVAQELLRGHLTASRVVTFRRTWMHLTDLNRRLIAAPVSLCVVMAMLVFSIVLHLYEGLEKVTSSKSEVRGKERVKFLRLTVSH